MFLANEVDVTPLDPSGYVLRLRDCWGGAPDPRLSKSVTAPVRLYVVEEPSQPDYGPDSIIGEADGSAEA